MKRFAFFAVAPFALAASLCAAPIFAQGGEGEIAIGGEFLMRIRAASPGGTLDQRADIVNSRLVPILSIQDLKSTDIRVIRMAGDNYAIRVRDRLLITVSREDGAPNGLTARKQAEAWAAAARRVLPRVNAKTNPNAQDGE